MCCKDVLTLLDALSSGRLPVEVCRAVQTHLADCAACRAALGRIDSVAGAMAGAHTPAVPQGLAARVMVAARRRRQVEPWDLLRWWRLTSPPMRALAAAMLAMGLTMGLAMGWTVAVSFAVRTDPLEVYRLDVLAEAPEGSLAGSYLTLVATMNLPAEASAQAGEGGY